MRPMTFIDIIVECIVTIFCTIAVWGLVASMLETETVALKILYAFAIGYCSFYILFFMRRLVKRVN